MALRFLVKATISHVVLNRVFDDQREVKSDAFRNEVQKELESLRTLPLMKLDGCSEEWSIVRKALEKLAEAGYMGLSSRSTDQEDAPYNPKVLTGILRQFARELLSFDNDLFQHKASFIENIKAKRHSLREELRGHQLTPEREALLRQVISQDDVTLQHCRLLREDYRLRTIHRQSTHGRDVMRGFVNLDQSCVINSVLQASLSLQSIGKCQPNDAVCHALSSLKGGSELYGDATHLRDLIGSEFCLVEAGKLTWFPPRIFVTKLINSCPTLFDATRSSVSGIGLTTSDHIHSLIVTGSSTTVEELVDNNNLRFSSLPQVLILDLIHQFNPETIQSVIPRHLEVSTISGKVKHYQLRAVIVNERRTHSKTLIPTRDDLFIEISDTKVTRDVTCDLGSTSILFYE